MILRECNCCGKQALREEDLELFVMANNGSLYGRAKECKECNKVRSKAYNETNKGKEVARRGNYKKSYGITLEEYDIMYEAQNGVCSICKRTDGGTKHGHFSVDHNHKTGEVRGLLCNSCNVGLGYFKDNTHILAQAIDYLEDSEGGVSL